MHRRLTSGGTNDMRYWVYTGDKERLKPCSYQSNAFMPCSICPGEVDGKCCFTGIAEDARLVLHRDLFREVTKAQWENRT